MSYNEQATKINEKLKSALIGLKDTSLSDSGRKDEESNLVDAILWFGQVAKYRCRSNVAYDNFARMVFDGIVAIERQQIEGQEFAALKAKRELQ